MTNEERIEIIEEAIELIQEAMILVDDAVDGKIIKDNYRAYGKYGFDQLLGQGNPYNGSLNSIIKSFEEEDEDEEF